MTSSMASVNIYFGRVFNLIILLTSGPQRTGPSRTGSFRPSKGLIVPQNITTELLLGHPISGLLSSLQHADHVNGCLGPVLSLQAEFSFSAVTAHATDTHGGPSVHNLFWSN